MYLFSLKQCEKLKLSNIFMICRNMYICVVKSRKITKINLIYHKIALDFRLFYPYNYYIDKSKGEGFYERCKQ